MDEHYQSDQIDLPSKQLLLAFFGETATPDSPDMAATVPEIGENLDRPVSEESLKKQLEASQADNVRLCKKIASLTQELEQCNRRNAAIGSVFIWTFEREQKLSKETTLLELRELNLHKQKEEFKAKKQRVEIEKVQQPLMKSFELDMKDLELRKKEAGLAVREKRLEIEKVGLEERKRMIDEYVIEQKNFAGLASIEVEISNPNVGTECISHQSTQAKKTLKHKCTHLLVDTACATALEEFVVKEKAKFEVYDFPVSIDTMRNANIQQLRRHDYYKGWLDSMRAQDRLEAYKRGDLKPAEAKHLLDDDDPRSPSNAGFNVGVTFGWSALCRAYGETEHDIRLDDRVWSFKDIVQPTEGEKGPFWEGVESGNQNIKERFFKKKQSGSWGPRCGTSPTKGVSNGEKAKNGE